MQRLHDSPLCRLGAVALSSDRPEFHTIFLFKILIDIKYLHMLSNFQEHFQHLQHLSFSSYFSGLQRKLPLSSLGYSHPRRHYHMASIRQANCYLEFFGFLKSRQGRWVRIFSTKPDYLDLIPRTYMVEQETLLRKLSYGLYIHLVTQTPSPTHQINERPCHKGSC